MSPPLVKDSLHNAGRAGDREARSSHADMLTQNVVGILGGGNIHDCDRNIKRYGSTS